MPPPTTTFSATGSVTTFTALTAGTYEITVKGAQGGTSASSAAGGDGAEMIGDFTLAAGAVLEIVVGQAGGAADPNGTGGGGGGGGSFVIETNDGSGSVDIPLVIAGGGGGGGGGGTVDTAGGGQIGSNGAAGTGSGGLGGTAGGPGGTAGNNSNHDGGGGGYGGGAGGLGRFSTAPAAGSRTGFGGGAAGYGGGFAPFFTYAAGAGGFGGGGGGGYGGGGGGGYGGGGGGGYHNNVGGFGGGGGAGSLLAHGTVVTEAAAENAGDGSIIIANGALCYLLGTHILTPTGEIPVEQLRIGDAVVTRWQGIQPIKWIGRQSFDARAAGTDRAQIPVRIKVGALGERLPARDLFVSPGHSLLLDETLVLASALVNGVTITQDDAPDAIHYFQIDLGTHDCVIAEGTWAETFADCVGLREVFHNVAEFHALYPRHRPPEVLSLCAPRPERGKMLDAVLRPVVARAMEGVEHGAPRGCIDRIAWPWKIEGWAQDPAHPELPVLLDIQLEGRSVGTVLACDYREDLLDAGMGQGRCSFEFTSPVRLRPEAIRTLTVRRVDGAEIAMSPRLLADLGDMPIVTEAARLPVMV